MPAAGAAAIYALLVGVVVVAHYEMLRLLSRLIPRLGPRRRLRVVVGVFGAICAHIGEVWVFGAAIYLMVRHGGFGTLGGNFDGSLADCVYFSFTNYTTVGYGDIEPFGGIRFLSGLEAITGLSLITWSASFLFAEAGRIQDDGRER